MGMAAGFGGLFQTPLAATFFALEVLVVGALFYEAMLPAMSAAFTASFTSHLLGLEKFSVSFSDTFSVNPQTIAKLILIAIVFGITGGAFSYFLAFAKEKLAKFIKILTGGFSLQASSFQFCFYFYGKDVTVDLERI